MEIKKKNNLTKGLVIFSLITILLVVLATFFGNKYQRLTGENKSLLEQLNTRKDKIVGLEKERLVQKDSLTQQIEYREKKNDSLQVLYDEKVKVVIDIREKPIYIPQTLPEATNYFNNRYATKENKNDSTKVLLVKNTVSKVIYDLESGDKAIETIPIQEAQIEIGKTMINNLELDKQSFKLQLTSAEVEILRRKELQDLSDKSIVNLNKQIKIVKTKSILHKWLIPVGTVIGGFIGYQIAK